MNGFLVLANGEMDDVPMRWELIRANAVTFAKAFTEEDVCAMARNILRRDTSIVHCISVIDFIGGMPVRCEVVKDFDVADLKLVDGGEG